MKSKNKHKNRDKTMDQKGPDIGRTNFKGCIIYPAVQATRAKCWDRGGEGGQLTRNFD